jgi:hypothetical protein
LRSAFRRLSRWRKMNHKVPAAIVRVVNKAKAVKAVKVVKAAPVVVRVVGNV